MPNTILKAGLNVPVNVDNGTLSFKDIYKKEADAIVVSVILGFTATRYHLGQPCQFDYERESPNVLEEIEKAVNDIVKVRQRYSALGLNDEALLEHLKRELEEVKTRIREGGLTYWESTRRADTERRGVLEADIKTIAFALKDESLVAEASQFMNVLDGVSYTLSKIDKDMGRYLQDGQSVHGGAGELISGVQGGAHSYYKERQAIELEKTAEVVQGAKSSENWGKIYEGRGAYTGVIHDSVNEEKILQPTIRVKVKNENGERWKGDPEGHYWQLVGADSPNSQINLSNDVKEGMGTWTAGDPVQQEGSHLVGYVHGMCSAIQKCRECGPWTEPFELSTGSQTTKISSCFPCTTYMYATGFPPSSSHLGRGESWVPPAKAALYTQTSNQPGQAIAGCDSPWVNDDLSTWHRDIYHYLNLGFSFLNNSNVKKTCVSSEYTKRLGNYGCVLENLDLKLQALQADGTESEKKKRVANLFLDALTVHDKEQSRLARVLKPACEIMKDVERRMLAG
ncbi:hypothetical protein KIH87_13125 [Paraneptunicella aestuarii]|uniref:hypothetical protein n=1 Tax=Paraneptunicella aestuarii TaxID=2831148 RepID=UPI001E57DCFC|nr:hypothetical protein [Paraneptunicella aestuarii]UAA37647.1 hypothetical protein KIH87_13125 [Paraneptunicella aestuarii]